MRVDALDIVVVCVRRWWVMVPILALAAAVGLNLTHDQKPVYAASGGYALVYAHYDPSANANGAQDPRSPNPLSANGGALIAEALIADFMTSKTQIELGGTGNSGAGPGEAANGAHFTVQAPTPGLSTYLVKSWGPDEEGVRAVVDGVLASAPVKAADIQKTAGAPEMSQYTTFVTAPTQVAEMPAQSATKMLVAVFAIAIMAGAALCLVVDRLIKRRSEKTRKRGRATAGDTNVEVTTRRALHGSRQARRSPFPKKAEPAVEPDAVPSGRARATKDARTPPAQPAAPPSPAAPVRGVNGATSRSGVTTDRGADTELQLVAPSVHDPSAR
ncbi:MAG: hypothetical protein ACOYBY_11525 [Dermatophilaceae bacterium]